MSAEPDRIARESRVAIERGSKSFALASHLFEPSTRTSAHMLYAWCRYCDDAIDGQELGFGSEALRPEARRSRLRRLQDETRRALAGEAVSEPVFIGLSRVVERYRIPARHPLELLEGFAMDVEGRQYGGLEETLSYCYHVAGVVGVMMAYVMGARDPNTLNRASDLGIALQLTNIARDVVEDARMGRVYVPASWLSEAGISAEAILEPGARPALHEVVSRLLHEADRYYRSGEAGLPDLPFRAAWAIATASAVYREIGRVVLARGSRAWDQRAVVGKPRKLGLAATGLLRALSSRARSAEAGVSREGLWTRANLGS